jgi:hypothetical protein
MSLDQPTQTGHSFARERPNVVASPSMFNIGTLRRPGSRVKLRRLPKQLPAKHHNRDRVKIQLAPALHWCSDADSRCSPISRRCEGICAPPRQRHRSRLHRPVWLSPAAPDPRPRRLAQRGRSRPDRCNRDPYLPQLQLEFPLHSGVTPLNAFERRGINTAIGLDEAGINDDRHILQEMRMVLRAHRVPGMEDGDVPAPAKYCAWRPLVQQRPHPMAAISAPSRSARPLTSC